MNKYKEFKEGIKRYKRYSIIIITILIIMANNLFLDKIAINNIINPIKLAAKHFIKINKPINCWTLKEKGHWEYWERDCTLLDKSPNP